MLKVSGTGRSKLSTEVMLAQSWCRQDAGERKLAAYLVNVRHGVLLQWVRERMPGLVSEGLDWWYWESGVCGLAGARGNSFEGRWVCVLASASMVL